MIRFIKQSKIVCAVALCLIFSLSAFFVISRGNRHVFYFPAFDGGKLTSEVRKIQSIPNPLKTNRSQKVSVFVDELLLGPQTERCRPLFSLGTRAEFCFVSGDKVFVGLSKDALYENAQSAQIKVGTDLFRKNILKNFAYIKSVELFVDGKPVFENSKKS